MSAPPIMTQVIDIPLVGGLAEHVDSKLVEPGAFLTLQNVEHTEAGALRKRQGYGTLTTSAVDTYTVPAAKHLDLHEGALTLIGDRPSDSLYYETQAWLWSWSPSLEKWLQHSSTSPLTIKRRPVIRARIDLASSVPHHVRCTNGVELWVYTDGTDVSYEIHDGTTRKTIIGSFTTAPGLPKFGLFACNTGATLVYRNGADVHRVNFDATTLSWGSDVVVYTAAAAVTVWDAAPTQTTNIFIFSFYDSAAGLIRSLRINTSTAAITHNITAVPLAAATYISVACNSAAAAIAWYSNAGGVECYHASTATLAALYAPVAVDAGGSGVALLVVGIASAGNAHVAWQSSPGGFATPIATSIRPVDSTGAFVGSVRRCYWTSPATRPWLASDGNLYMLVAAVAGLGVLCLTQHPQTGYATRPVKWCGCVGVIEGYASGGGASTQNFPTPSATAAGTGVILPILAAADTHNRRFIDALEVDASREQEGLWRSTQASGLLLLSGSMVAAFDGRQVVELGFHDAPGWVGAGYGLTYQASGVEGDAVATHVYEYYAIYVWRDNRGNVHRSRPSLPLLVSINNGGGFNFAKVTLTIATTAMQRKEDRFMGGSTGVSIQIYRSLKNTTGAHYQCASVASNAVNAASVTIDDLETDAALLAAGRGQLYTDGGVFENWPPPPSSFIHSHGGRVWLVSTEEDREVWASKLLVKDEPPSFSPYLRIRIEDSPSEVVALGSLDDELVIFTRDHVYLLSGPGPTDAGGGQFFETPRLVSSSTGCLDARSVVSWEGGVFFQAKEGLCLLQRGGVKFAGQAAKATLASYPNIRGALLDAERRRIYWLCDGGLDAEGITLVYDYQHDAWYTWKMASGHRTVAQAIWNSKRVIGDEDGTHYEASGTNPGRDPGAGWPEAIVETPWIRLGAVGGYQRCKRVVVTGDTLGSHTLSLDIYTDWSSTTTQTEDVTQTTSGSDPERAVVVVARQKCSAVKIKLTDSAGALTGEKRAGTWLSGLSLQIGAKTGVTKEPAAGGWL